MKEKINKLAKEINKNAVEHGWYDEERSFGEIIALCHSELSEALEEYRKGKDVEEIYYTGKGYTEKLYIATSPTECCKKPEGIPIELADCIIRILDYCGHKGIDIGEAIEIKHEYNKTRPYKHGDKKI